MEGAFGEKSLAFLGNCPGRMPWLPRSGDSVCKCRPRVVLKGASNVFYANTASALSIPPWSNALSQFLDDHWEAFNDPRYDSKWVETRVLEVLQKDYWQDKMMDQKREQEYRASVAYVMEKRRLELGCGDAVSQTESFANADMRFAEYGALCRGQSEDDRQIHIKGGVIYRNEFICRKPSEEIPREFSKWFDKVMIAEKLREVRAFVGFSRLYPIGGEEESGAKPAELTSGQVTWLPALVIRGEGIFLRFNEKRLREWETRNDVIERVQILERNLNATKDRRNSPDIKEKLVPRWLLAHTLAHVMIRQLAVDCGYPISSLKERLYVSAEAGKEMFGILIHTSTNDVSGSLGGLIELGEPSNLYRVLKDAIENASWCSSDPSCIESMASGNNGMNLAACHSCVLLPEISCEEFNSLLDRALLIGTLDNPDIGFFKDLLIGD
jgi:hypothetical protein